MGKLRRLLVKRRKRFRIGGRSKSEFVLFSLKSGDFTLNLLLGVEKGWYICQYQTIDSERYRCSKSSMTFSTLRSTESIIRSSLVSGPSRIITCTKKQ